MNNVTEEKTVFNKKAADYFTTHYHLTPTHSEVLNVLNYIEAGNVLDLGCGRGRNSLYLNLCGFEVTAVDHSAESIHFLNQIIDKEQLTAIRASLYDINQADISTIENAKTGYDLIISTVVMMFLKGECIPAIIQNMQQHTKVGGYNLIVCAMNTAEYPCPVPFSFTFGEGELANYYQDWTLLKYNEDLGHLHKTDEQGNRIQIKFVTMLAKKTA